MTPPPPSPGEPSGPPPPPASGNPPPPEAIADSRTALLLLSPAFLAVGWLVSQVRWVWSNRPDMQFGWIVLMLSAYLLWEKWPLRPALRQRLGPVSALGALAGIALLYVVQAYHAAFGTGGASLYAQVFGTILVACSSLHYAFGPAGLRTFAFPFLFLLVAMPMPSAIQSVLTHSLQDTITSLNVETLNLIGIPAQRLGNLIQLPGGTVGVNEACSGIRSLQSSIMATLFIGYLTLQSNLLRSLLFAGGMLTAVAGNFVRSFYLSYTANARGVDTVNQVHDAAGWSILAFTAAGVAALAWWFARLEKAAASPVPRRLKPRS